MCLPKGRTSNVSERASDHLLVSAGNSRLGRRRCETRRPLHHHHRHYRHRPPDFRDRRRSQQGPGAPSPSRCKQVIGAAWTEPARCIRGERACPKPSAAAAAPPTASPTATAAAATCCPRQHRRKRRRRRGEPTWAAHPCQVRSGLAWLAAVRAGCSSCCGASRRSEGRRTSGRTAIGTRAAVAGGVSTASEIRAPEIIAGADRRADITVRKEREREERCAILS